MPESPEFTLNEFIKEVGKDFLQNFVSLFGLAFFIIFYGWALLGENLMDLKIMMNLLLTVLGLTIFIVGLRYGLMPLGEQIGTVLPRKASRPLVLLCVFVLGVLCTIAEPAIASLKQAGKNTDRNQAPLLAKILDEATILMLTVGVGVGVAAVFGSVRLIYDLKFRCCLVLAAVPSFLLTIVCLILGGSFPAVVGLAWDCGAVTTGPVTVPIVLALGIGVSASTKAQSLQRRETRALSEITTVDEDEGPDLSGFGIVTFASLLPVLSVWALAFVFGGSSVTAETIGEATGHTDAEQSNVILDSLWTTTRSIVPLVGFLLFVQFALIREALPDAKVLALGLICCFIGMFLFSGGLTSGLMPLGSAVGKALPKAVDRLGPLFGPVAILLFGFLSGMGATFSEPALLALGEQVEKLTNGKFSKMKLVLSVAIGVGFGITTGLAKVYFRLNIAMILFPGYLLCFALTYFSDEAIASVAWDSAGVTTGPVTVPIVLASGLALGKASGAAEGFGILTCASIGPILSVLVAGLMLDPEAKSEQPERRLTPVPRASSVSTFTRATSGTFTRANRSDRSPMVVLGQVELKSFHSFRL